MDGSDSILVLLQEWSLLAKSVLGALGNSRVATREVRLTLHVRSFLKCRKVHAELSFKHATISCLCRCFAVVQAAIHAAQALFRGRLWSEAGWTACSQPTRSTLARYHISDGRTFRTLGQSKVKDTENKRTVSLLQVHPQSASEYCFSCQMASIFDELWTITVKLMDDIALELAVYQSTELTWRLKIWKLGRQKSAKTGTMNQGYGATNPGCRKMLNGSICPRYCSTGTNCEQQKQQPHRGDSDCFNLLPSCI